MSAYLSAKDADLLPWVDEMARDGLLAEAIKAGLRIARALWGCPGGPKYLRRGVLSDVFVAGLLPAPHLEQQGLGPVATSTPRDPEAMADPYTALAQSLDRTLNGL